jgi:hypothetical protein
MSHSFVVLLDTTMKARKDRSQIERDLKIPSQTDERVLERCGFSELRNGDVIFTQDKACGPDGIWQEDVVIAWVTDE